MQFTQNSCRGRHEPVSRGRATIPLESPTQGLGMVSAGPPVESNLGGPKTAHLGRLKPGSSPCSPRLDVKAESSVEMRASLRGGVSRLQLTCDGWGLQYGPCTYEVAGLHLGLTLSSTDFVLPWGGSSGQRARCQAR